MRQLLSPQEPATASRADSQELGAETEPTAGARLDHARAADREWRGALALRLYRRLGKLRKSDHLIERGGAALSVCLLVAVVATLGGGGVEWVMLLVYGIIATTLGALGAIAGIAWIHDRTQTWMTGLGLTEEGAPAGQKVEKAQESPGESWLCSVCWNRNPAEADTCSGCARKRPAEEARLTTRVTQFGSALGTIVIITAKVLLAAVCGLLLVMVLPVLLALLVR